MRSILTIGSTVFKKCHPRILHCIEFSLSDSCLLLRNLWRMILLLVAHSQRIRPRASRRLDHGCDTKVLTILLVCPRIMDNDTWLDLLSL